MSCSAKRYLGGLAILALALPVWAGSEKTYSAEWDLSQATTIGSTQITAGTYRVIARPNQNTLDIVQNGKVIAQTECHWIQLPKKADETEVDTDNNKIVQVQFAGKTEAVQVGETSAGN